MNEEHRIQWRTYDKIIDWLYARGFPANYPVAGAMDVADLVYLISFDRDMDVKPEEFAKILVDSVFYTVREIAVEAILILMGKKEYSTETWEKLNEIRREEVS